MKKLLSFTRIASVAAVLMAVISPGLANAQILLDTGTPTSAAGPAILSSAQSLAGEFQATKGEDITQLSAYLSHNTSQTGYFTFDLYTTLPSNANRSAQPVFTPVTATFSTPTGGWNSASVNWVLPSTGDYWLVIRASGDSFDAPLETSSSTGPKPAVAFAYASTSGYFSTTGAPAIGLEVVAAPEPESYGLLGLGLASLVLIGRRRWLRL